MFDEYKLIYSGKIGKLVLMKKVNACSASNYLNMYTFRFLWNFSFGMVSLEVGI